MEFEF